MGISLKLDLKDTINKAGSSIKASANSTTLSAAATNAATNTVNTVVADNSKTALGNLAKNIFNNYGGVEGYKAQQEKQAREKAIAKAKENGTPLAPNGLAYDESELKALMKSKNYTQAQAIAELSKLDKYAKSVDIAPNGATYSENDIAYLVKNGYTRASAIEYLSKTSKYKKTTNEDIQAANKETIKKAAEDYVNTQLDNLVSDQLKKIEEQFGVKTTWDDDVKAKVRSIIRGEANVVFANDKIVKSAIDKTTETIEKYYKSYVTSNIDKAYNKLNNKLNEAVFDKATNYTKKVSEEEVKKLLTGQIDNQTKKLNGISNKLGDLDKKMGKYGLNVGLQSQFKSAISSSTKQITDQLMTQIKPQLNEAIKATQTVNNEIKKYKEQVNQLKQKAVARIEEWKNKAMSKIKAEEERLVKSALGSLTKSLGSIKLKF